MIRLVPLAVAAVAGLSLLATTPAIATPNEQPNAAISALAHASPAALSDVASSTSSGKVALRNLNATATIAATSADPITIAAPARPTISVTLPYSQNDAANTSTEAGVGSYDNGNGSSTVTVAHTDASVAFHSVIWNASAPSNYPYHLSLPTGATIVPNKSGGALSILDADGAWISGVAPAWAVDANGTAVPTHYEISGSTISQIVDHSATTAYPVVADPWLGVALISKVVWVTGTAPWGPTAEVFPTSAGRNTVFAPAAANEAAWGEALEKTTRSRLNHNNLHDQFSCHWQVVRYASPNKSSWNLDSGRPDVGLAATIAASCNPGGGD